MIDIERIKVGIAELKELIQGRLQNEDSVGIKGEIKFLKKQYKLHSKINWLTLVFVLSVIVKLIGEGLSLWP